MELICKIKESLNIKFPRFGFYDAMGYAFFIE